MIGVEIFTQRLAICLLLLLLAGSTEVLAMLATCTTKSLAPTVYSRGHHSQFWYSSSLLRQRYQRSLYRPASLLRSSHSSTDQVPSKVPNKAPQSLAIIGGGLAGLATCHYWLEKIAAATESSKTCAEYKIVIYDTQPKPGLGGASAVAGGLVHPLSPRGKLVYRGLEGLQATNELIDAAVTAASSSSLVSASDIILRDCVWRCAQTTDHVKQLKKTAQDLPNLCEWIDGDEPSAPWSCFEATRGGEKTTPVLGGLRMFQGCRVVHVPSYLHGLWIACQQEALALNDNQEETEDGRSKVTVEWTHLGPEIRYREFNKEIESYDNVVLAAGAGIFQEYLKPNNEETSEGRETQQHQNHIFPVHLVRGQSIEFSSSLDGNNSAASIDDAFLCGKYISPLPRGEGSDGARRRVLVGATHEFKSDPMSREQVEEDMKCATQFMAPQLWEGNHFTKDRITEGYRVQSQRGPNGRLPLLGKLNSHLVPQDSDHTQLQHKNMWIFTGLSSRGLLYHALLADLLVSAVWADDEAGLMDQYPELGWWKK